MTSEATSGAAAPEPQSVVDALTEPQAPPVLATPAGGADGVNRCPKCGASETRFAQARGTLVCGFCRFEWSAERLDDVMGLSTGIAELKGTVMSTAAADIVDDSALVTLKCDGCGAEVVIDTEHNLRARCHWCKHVLALNNRIPNGAVPDGILPFTVTKEQAMEAIKAFVNDRKTFALPAFWDTFSPDNIMGVYLPYMTVDGNIGVRLDGVGEVLRERIRVSDDKVRYRIDRFKVVRTVDIHVDDLIVETNEDKANIHSTTSTTNIINAVLPFDVKNVVRFNANYLGDQFTSERRDMDVDEAEAYAGHHFMTIGRSAVHASVSGYDRGVRWEAEQVHVRGSRWTSMLLPVWLYGFIETKNGRQVTHYLAVNGRTGATMGSVPINTGKAVGVSFAVAAVISVITWPMAIAALLLGA